MAHGIDAGHGRCGASGAANQNRQPILLQNGKLAIYRNCQAGRCRCQEHVDNLAAHVVRFIGNLEQEQNRCYQHNSHNQRIAKGRFPLLMKLHPDSKGQNTQCNAKVRRIDNLFHQEFTFSFFWAFLFSRCMVHLTLQAVTPKVITVDTVQIITSCTAVLFRISK